MENLEVTTLSSRGQIVIPEEIRENLHLKTGEKFIVIGKDGTIILKKIEMPSFKDFETILKKTHEFAKKKGIKPRDIEEALQRVRKHESGIRY